MTMKDARALAERYGMEIQRDPVTREAWGCSVDSAAAIPELDALADDHQPNDIGTVIRATLPGYGYRYELHVPVYWFDLYGWRDSND